MIYYLYTQWGYIGFVLYGGKIVEIKSKVVVTVLGNSEGEICRGG
jgi:hypothetical protein